MFKCETICTPASFLNKVLVIAAMLFGIVDVSPATAQVGAPPEMPGMTQGTGTDFTLPNSPYLKVTLHSSVPVTLTLTSVPEIVDLTIDADPAAGSAVFTFGGFTAGTLYYRYMDNVIAPVTFYTDSTGSYTYTQDLSTRHHVWFRDRPSTLYLYDDLTGGDCNRILPTVICQQGQYNCIPRLCVADGGTDDCTPIGTWDATYKTCTLTRNVTEQIVILADGITLDGAGFKVSSATTSSLAYGVRSEGFSNVTIQNLVIRKSLIGVYVTIGQAASVDNIKVINIDVSETGPWSPAIQSILVTKLTVTDSTISGGYYGIKSEYVTNLTVTNSNISGGSYGIDVNGVSTLLLRNNTIISGNTGLFVSGSTVLNAKVYNNNFINNPAGHIQYFCASGETSNNLFNMDPPIGGNYFSDWNPSITGGCGEIGNFCAPYTGISSVYPTFDPPLVDNYPWTMQDGWLNVVNQPPVADAGGPYFGNEGTRGLPVNGINMSGASASDTEGDILSYKWSVDSVLCSFDNDALPNPTLTCDDNGDLTVTLAVSDGKNDTVTDTATVTVNNVKPTASVIAWSGLLYEGERITLSLSIPYDPSLVDTSAGFTYAFDCGNGIGAWGSESSVVCSPVPDNGSRNFYLYIRDKNNGITEYPQPLVFTNLAPIVATPVISSEPSTVYDSVTARATFEDPGNNDGPFTCTVNYGDGPDILNGDVVGNTCTGPTHQYSTAGTFTVTVKVTDKDLSVGSNTSSHIVKPLGKTDQEITFGALSGKTYGDAPFQVSATGGGSGNPVTFSSQSANCSTTGNNGSTVTIQAAGDCTIRASQEGNDNYNAAPYVDQMFTIGQATSTTVVSCLASVVYSGSAQTPCTASVTGTGGLSLTPTLTYASNIDVGMASASYTYAGDANHSGSNGSGNFEITLAPSTVTVTCSPASVVYSGSAQTPCTALVTGTGGLSLTPTLTYASNIDVGTASASYTYAGDANHSGSNGSGNFEIAKADSTVTVTCPAGVIYSGSEQTVCSAAVTGAGGFSDTLTVSYENNVSVGKATARADFPGQANHKNSSNSTAFNIYYDWTGFLQPINDTAHQVGVQQSNFKLGQNIPAKFILKNAAGAVVQQTGNPTFTRSGNRGACGDNTPVELIEIVQASTVPEYQWDGSQYHYNWKTKGLTAGAYRIYANLADGTSQWVDICLTK